MDFGDVLAVMIAAMAVGVAVWSAHQSYRASQAQMITKILDDYGAAEMAEALTSLGKLRDKVSPEVRESWRTCDPAAANGIWQTATSHDGYVDLHRRHVHWFYKNAWQLYEKKFLGKTAMEIVTGTNGYALLFEVVWGLSRTKHILTFGEPDDERFRWFEKMQSAFPVSET